MMEKFFTLLIVICAFKSTLGGKSARQREKEILDTILSKDSNYDKMIRPQGEGGSGPTVVTVNMFVRSIATIDDVKMEYKVQLTFREMWLDSRLSYSKFNNTSNLKYLTLTESEKIWKPDLFYSNEKVGLIHKNLKPNLYIRVFPNGELLYSIRISLTLACPMQLRLFPLDKQTCSIKMGSWGWTTEDLIFKWKEGEDPVQVASNLQLFRFVMEEYSTSICDSYTATGVYSCLRADFVFAREFRYYLINVYLPSCIMLICVSWVSFWLDPKSVPARITIGITTLLAISNQNSKINQSLPPVSYMKALDVWTGCTLNFIFGSLLEFAIVNYAMRCDKQKAAIDKQIEEARKKAEEENVPENGVTIEDGLEIRSRSSKKSSIGSDDKKSSGSGSDGKNHQKKKEKPPDVERPSTSKSRSNSKDGGAAVISMKDVGDKNKNHSEYQIKHLMVNEEGSSSVQYYDDYEDPEETAFNNLRIVDRCSCTCAIDTGKSALSSMSKMWISLFPSKAKRIDIISRIFFPILFALFNLSYWCAYLPSK